jgi:hypothetical protein
MDHVVYLETAANEMATLISLILNLIFYFICPFQV